MCCHDTIYDEYEDYLDWVEEKCVGQTRVGLEVEMTEAQSKKLQVGNTVATDSLPEGEHHEGTIIEANWHAVKIKWDDGQVGCIDHRGMGKITVVALDKSPKPC